MKFPRNISMLRRWAAVAVAANIGAVLIAAALLPPHAIAVLPVLGLILPLLTTGVLDAAAKRCGGPLSPSGAA